MMPWKSPNDHQPRSGYLPSRQGRRSVAGGRTPGLGTKGSRAVIRCRHTRAPPPPASEPAVSGRGRVGNVRRRVPLARGFVWAIFPGVAPPATLRRPCRGTPFHTMPSTVSCFRRSWPQAASMSWPFSMRRVAVTPAFFRTSWKARQWERAGRSHSRPSTVL